MEKKDMVNKPHHYVGEFGLEVEDVLQNFMPRYTDSYVAHRVSSAIEYLLRSPLKNGREDVEKARKNLNQVIEYLERRDEKEAKELKGALRDSAGQSQELWVNPGVADPDNVPDVQPQVMYTEEQLDVPLPVRRTDKDGVE